MPVEFCRENCPKRIELCRSNHGTWNEGHRIGCGQWNDSMLPSPTRTGQFSPHARSASKPTPKSLTPQQSSKFRVLATLKKFGRGPNCKESRCAATDPHYTKPNFGMSDKQRRKRRVKKTEIQSPPTTIVKKTYSNMIHMRNKFFNDENYDITMGLKNLKKVIESIDVEMTKVFPMPYEQKCERKCLECTLAPSKRLEQATDVPANSTDATSTGLKCLTTSKTETSITEAGSCEPKADEISVGRLLTDVNSNLMPEPVHEQTSRIPVTKLQISTPLPRIALLQPKLESLPPLSKLEEGLNKSPVKIPRPKSWKSSKMHNPLPFTTSTKSPRKASSYPQWVMPRKPTSGLFTPQQTFQLQSTSPRSHPLQREPQTQPVELCLASPELNQAPMNTSQQSSTKSSNQSSQGGGSVTATTSDLEKNSLTTEEAASINCSTPESIPATATPMYCLCSSCGKPERVSDTFQPNASGMYRSNPLYSPLRHLAGGTHPIITHNNTTSTNVPNPTSVGSRKLHTILEIVVLVLLGGILSLGLIPYVQLVFRAYVVDYCRCYSKGTAPGEAASEAVKGGVVKWVSCLLDANRATLTLVRWSSHHVHDSTVKYVFCLGLDCAKCIAHDRFRCRWFPGGMNHWCR